MSDKTREEEPPKPSKAELFALIALLLVFLAYSVFVAVRLDTGIIPDEKAHFIFAKHFSSTWGLPPDTPETYALGWYITHNPFLYHWLNGRVINLVQLFQPAATDAVLLLVLRLLSSLYTVGTLIFLYLLSRLVIGKAWWPLLPVFLLSNTLMFVLLSGGVNYDNLAFLFCTAGIYYLTRVFSQQDYLRNSLVWMIFICLGCLVKFTVLPLALFMFIAWLVYTITRRAAIFPLKSWDTQKIVLAALLVLLIFGNLAIYGYNLIVYQSLTPICADLFNEQQCAVSPYAQRYEIYGLDEPLSLAQAVAQGFPHPLAYLFDFWIKDMFTKTHGILGHKVYWPAHIIPFYQAFFLGVVFLAFRSWKRVSFELGSLLFLVIGYAGVVFYTNYQSDLAFAFQHFVLQGRYLFPIMGVAYVLTAYTLSQVGNKALRYASLAAAIVLFLAGGPFKFIKLYETVFATWFVR